MLNKSKNNQELAIKDMIEWALPDRIKLNGSSLIGTNLPNLINVIIISLLMISKIPTVSLKSINFNKKYTPLIILLIVICCVGIISNVWLSLVIISIIYICSIFYTIINNY